MTCRLIYLGVYFDELAAETIFGVAVKAVKLSRAVKVNTALRSFLNMIITSFCKKRFLDIIITLRRRKKVPIELMSAFVFLAKLTNQES